MEYRRGRIRQEYPWSPGGPTTNPGRGPHLPRLLSVDWDQEVAARMIYTASARRSGAWVSIDVAELPGIYSQARRLDRVERARGKRTQRA